MRFTLLGFLLTLSCSLPTHGQSTGPDFNSDTFWQKFRFENPGEIHPGPGDTVITVVSNRQFFPGTLRFMSEHREALTSALHYFSIWAHGGTWHIAPQNSLSNALATTPSMDRPWVVYTEGMGKIFTSDVDRGLRLAAAYGVNVLLMDYPSIRTDAGSLRNYYFAIGNARAAYRYFSPVYDSIRLLRNAGKLGGRGLSLFFHSMGNNVAKKMGGKTADPVLQTGKWVDNIILNAPCVRARGHRKWLGRMGFAQNVVVNFNPEDGTLKWARILSFRKQLGDRLRGPLVPGALYVNFNTLSGTGHSNFLSLPGRPPVLPEAFRFYKVLFAGQAISPVSPAFRPGRYRGLGVDILPD